MYFYEIKCRSEYDDWYKYLYIASASVLNSFKDTATDKVPEKVKFLIRNKYLYPVRIRKLNAVEYFYNKYLKKEFHLGNKIIWEKENI